MINIFFLNKFIILFKELINFYKIIDEKKTKIENNNYLTNNNIESIREDLEIAYNEFLPDLCI